MDETPEKIADIDRFLILFAAACVDMLQFGLMFFFPPLGWVLSMMVGVFALIFFFGVYHHFNIKTHGARAVARYVVPLLTETTPLFNSLAPSYFIVSWLAIAEHNKQVEKMNSEDGEMGL